MMRRRRGYRGGQRSNRRAFAPVRQPNAEGRRVSGGAAAVMRHGVSAVVSALGLPAASVRVAALSASLVAVLAAPVHGDGLSGVQGASHALFVSNSVSSSVSNSATLSCGDGAPAESLAIAGLPAGVPLQRPAYVLTDQFERVVTGLPVLAPVLSSTASARRAAPVVFLVAGRDGSSAMARWAQQFAAHRPVGESRARVVFVADAAGAPRVLHGWIRRSMPRDSAQAILIDFVGDLSHPLSGPRPPLVAVRYCAAGQLESWESLASTPTTSIVARLLSGN